MYEGVYEGAATPTTLPHAHYTYSTAHRTAGTVAAASPAPTKALAGWQGAPLRLFARLRAASRLCPQPLTRPLHGRCMAVAWPSHPTTTVTRLLLPFGVPRLVFDLSGPLAKLAFFASQFNEVGSDCSKCSTYSAYGKYR